jgi:hypothetical protein
MLEEQQILNEEGPDAVALLQFEYLIVIVPPPRLHTGCPCYLRQVRYHNNAHGRRHGRLWPNWKVVWFPKLCWRHSGYFHCRQGVATAILPLSLLATGKLIMEAALRTNHLDGRVRITPVPTKFQVFDQE